MKQLGLCHLNGKIDYSKIKACRRPWQENEAAHCLKQSHVKTLRTLVETFFPHSHIQKNTTSRTQMRRRRYSRFQILNYEKLTLRWETAQKFAFFLHFVKVENSPKAVGPCFLPEFLIWTILVFSNQRTPVFKKSFWRTLGSEARWKPFLRSFLFRAKKIFFRGKWFFWWSARRSSS